MTMTAVVGSSGGVERRTLPRDVGDALRRARVARGWSVREAERRLGVSHPYLLRLERGERCPSLMVAVRLAIVLDLKDAVAERLYELAVSRGPDGRVLRSTGIPAADDSGSKRAASANRPKGRTRSRRANACLARSGHQP